MQPKAPTPTIQKINGRLPWWKILLLFLLFSLLALGFYYSINGYFVEVLSILAITFFTSGILLLIVYIVSFDLFLWIIGKRSEYRKLFHAAQMTSIGLANAAIQYLPSNLEQEEKDRLKAEVPTFIQLRFMANINGLIMRVFVGAFAAAFALLGTIVLMKQNERIDVQNEKIDFQNKKIDIQTQLMESERRGSQVVLMNNVLEDLSREIEREKDKGKNDSTGYTLSSPLIGRIGATSQGFLPYQFLENGKLTEKEYSLERGQLLLAMVNSQIDSLSMDRIYQASSFKSAYLKSFNLRGTDLSGADLRGAYLIGADLTGADLRGADLMEANLIGINLRGTGLKEANLREADLKGAYLIGADLRGTYLIEAGMRGTYLMEADLSGASLNGANLREAYLDGADLRGANLRGAELDGAYMRGLKLNETKNLTFEQLTDVRTLYQSKGLADTLKQQLQKAKPCLFTEQGCPE